MQNVYFYIQDCAMRSTANESNFEKIDLWGISHANGNTKTSSEEYFSSQRACVSNFKALTLTQPKIYALKVLAVCGQLR